MVIPLATDMTGDGDGDEPPSPDPIGTWILAVDNPGDRLMKVDSATGNSIATPWTAIECVDEVPFE